MASSPGLDAPARALTKRSWGLLPTRLRLRRAPRWWQEVAFIVVSYGLYSYIRNGVPTRELAAFAHAEDVLAVERAMGLDFEAAMNSFVAGLDWLAVFANYFYATAHFVVTIGVLVWMYRAHPLEYRSLRTPLYAANVIALIGYWTYPLAPPRMLDGFIDTVVVFNTWGSWASDNVASTSNQFAAMPSMHFGWALWCGIVIVQLARSTWARTLGAAYPVVVLLVIVATANHFWLDAAGGALALAFGFALQRGVLGMPMEATQRALAPDIAA